MGQGCENKLTWIFVLLSIGILLHIRRALLLVHIDPSTLLTFMAVRHGMILISSHLEMHNIVFARMERKGRWILLRGNMRIEMETKKFVYIRN